MLLKVLCELVDGQTAAPEARRLGLQGQHEISRIHARDYPGLKHVVSTWSPSAWCHTSDKQLFFMATVMSLEIQVESQFTWKAASLINCFETSRQMAGTVTTNLMRGGLESKCTHTAGIDFRYILTAAVTKVKWPDVNFLSVKKWRMMINITTNPVATTGIQARRGQVRQ